MGQIIVLCITLELELEFFRISLTTLCVGFFHVACRGNITRIIEGVCRGNRPEIQKIGKDVPLEVKSLIQKCWAQEMNERPPTLSKYHVNMEVVKGFL